MVLCRNYSRARCHPFRIAGRYKAPPPPRLPLHALRLGLHRKSGLRRPLSPTWPTCMTHSAAPTCALGSSRSLATPKLHPPVLLTFVISRCLSCLTAVQRSQHALAPQRAAFLLSPVPLSPVLLSPLPLILPRSAQLSRVVGALAALKRRAREGSCTLLDAAGKLIAKAQVHRLHEPSRLLLRSVNSAQPYVLRAAWDDPNKPQRSRCGRSANDACLPGYPRQASLEVFESIEEECTDAVESLEFNKLEAAASQVRRVPRQARAPRPTLSSVVSDV